MIKFRDLKADEIECRVQSVKDSGCVLLLYKNARCDMSILDETVGCENWQRRHYECKGNLFCEIGIYDDGKKEWIWKGDCGVESGSKNSKAGDDIKKKGEASDSFKRAGFNWGIGRELYTAPFLFVKAADCKITKNKRNENVCNDKFIVKDITIENKAIKSLTIVNKKTEKVVYDNISNSQLGEQLTDNQPPKPKGEQAKPIDWEKQVKIYAEALASESDKTADDYIAEAEKKYQTHKAQAEVLLKWCKQKEERKQKEQNGTYRQNN